MRIKRRHGALSFETNTAHLIAFGACASTSAGEIRALEDQVAHLTAIVAELLDRAGLNDEEKLRITGTDGMFELAGD